MGFHASLRKCMRFVFSSVCTECEPSKQTVQTIGSVVAHIMDGKERIPFLTYIISSEGTSVFYDHVLQMSVNEAGFAGDGTIVYYRLE